MGDEDKKRWFMAKMNGFGGPAFRVNGGGYRCMQCSHILEPLDNGFGNIESYYCSNGDCRCCDIEIPAMDALDSIEAFDAMIQRLYS